MPNMSKRNTIETNAKVNIRSCMTNKYNKNKIYLNSINFYKLKYVCQ